MNSGKIGPLALIHVKTRQRYPLAGDFVIGRSTGNLVFDHDPKISGKHCLIRNSESGCAIYDLKSRTGIVLNGSALPPGKHGVLRAGAQITIGDQIFSVDQEPHQEPEPLRPANKRHTLYMLLGALGFAVVVVMAALVSMRPFGAVHAEAGQAPVLQRVPASK